MAFPALVAGGAVLGPVIAQALRWFFMAYGAATVVRIFTSLGIAWGTYQWVLAPAITKADQYWGSMPSDMVPWLRYLGVMEVASIIVSAYLLWGLKKLFLRKA